MRKKLQRSRVRAFWFDQHGSLHRRSDESFYRAKAEEHASLMAPEDRTSIVDFACGAGELLAELASMVQIEVASDFSEPMLTEAASRVAGSDITLLHQDGMTHAGEATQRVWTTSGGLNQYLDPPSLSEWLGLFSANEDARAIYLFDCVDPHRYRTLRLQSLYVDPAMPASTRLRRGLRKLKALPGGASRRPWAYLGSPSMGYAYAPAHFRELAGRLGLEVDFCSSRLYEYRFHAILRKRDR
jgi:hypothetical protein